MCDNVVPVDSLRLHLDVTSGERLVSHRKEAFPLRKLVYRRASLRKTQSKGGARREVGRALRWAEDENMCSAAAAGPKRRAGGRERSGRHVEGWEVCRGAAREVGGV